MEQENFVAQESEHEQLTDHEVEWSPWCWLVPLFFTAVTFAFFGIVAQSDQGQGIGQDGVSSGTRLSACNFVLLSALLFVSYTDIRWQVIPNWVTYSLLLIGLGANTFDLFIDDRWSTVFGTVGFADSFWGAFLLFVGLLMIFSRSGGGAGDVKLVAGIGAFLGLTRGFEALCLSFIICAALVFGWKYIRLFFNRLVERWKKPEPYLKGEPTPSPTTGMMNMQLPLAPFFTLGTIAVLIRDALIVDADPFQFL